VILTFDKSVPDTERRWIGALVRRAAVKFGFAAWEFQVACKTLRGDQIAECVVKGMAGMVDITLHPSRLANRAAARTDLAHELWHLVDCDMEDTLADLASHIPDPKRRARAWRRAYRRYETLHDRQSRIMAEAIL
jgi:hypothetical protein